MGAWEEIVDYTVPSNTTSVTLNNFGTITKDDFINIKFTHVNPISASSEVSIYPNTTSGVSGFDTQSNYWRQVLIAEGSSVFANRSNSFRLFFTNGNRANYGNVYMKVSENNKVNFYRINNDIKNNF